jgi:pimeloyl-ACP methyl ester carboxylesterase
VSKLAQALIAFERFTAGVKRHVVQVGDHRVVYSEGGKGETILLLHGFAASGDSWNRLAGTLTKKYRVIAPDLPGWGASTRIEAESYAYPAQLRRLESLVKALGLDRFHLVGHSMGGFLAAAYAAKFPERVITLCLLCPHGMTEPVPSDLSRSVEQGDNWLVVSSTEGFHRLLNNLFVKRPYIPGPIVKYLAQIAVRNTAKSRQIFDEIQSNEPPLIQRLSQISAPAMIVWGDQDRVLHVSSANLVKANLKQAELVILKGCGHMPLMEKTRAWIGRYLDFIADAGGQRAGGATA